MNEELSPHALWCTDSSVSPTQWADRDLPIQHSTKYQAAVVLALRKMTVDGGWGTLTATKTTKEKNYMMCLDSFVFWLQKERVEPQKRGSILKIGFLARQ